MGNVQAQNYAPAFADMTQNLAKDGLPELGMNKQETRTVSYVRSFLHGAGFPVGEDTYQDEKALGIPLNTNILDSRYSRSKLVRGWVKDALNDVRLPGDHMQKLSQRTYRTSQFHVVKMDRMFPVEVLPEGANPSVVRDAFETRIGYAYPVKSLASKGIHAEVFFGVKRQYANVTDFFAAAARGRVSQEIRGVFNNTLGVDTGIKTIRKKKRVAGEPKEHWSVRGLRRVAAKVIDDQFGEAIGKLNPMPGAGPSSYHTALSFTVRW